MSVGNETNPEKKNAPVVSSAGPERVRIFTYPKIIFIMPSLIAALVCGIGMTLIGDSTQDPGRAPKVAQINTSTNDAEKTAEVAAAAVAEETDTATATVRTDERPNRFGSTQSLLAEIFLLVFMLNLLVMSIDFPRFTVIALVLLFAAAGFFILWLNVYFELLPPLVRLLDNIFAVANSTFYFLFATAILINFAIIFVTRYLDYWEIMPNEILHNHGPFSDLERFPTMHLKFDKEIPDILEYALLRSGRLVLNVYSQDRAIVLDNVLWINSKEEELKRLLSRMEVRISTDPGTV